MPEGCGNPLLLAWLKEWWDEAREKNSKGALTYKKAFESMKACPITFDHPSEAVQLYGLGPKLCDRLTAKLEAHCRNNELPLPVAPNKAGKRVGDDHLPDQVTVPNKKPRKPRPYVPSLRSGPYAIILALSTVSEASSSGLTKNETIDLAQPHCDSSFTAPADPTKFYTAWNSMKTLQTKDLVCEFGRPTKRYALTEDGWETARRIRVANGFKVPEPPSNSREMSAAQDSQGETERRTDLASAQSKRDPPRAQLDSVSFQAGGRQFNTKDGEVLELATAPSLFSTMPPRTVSDMPQEEINDESKDRSYRSLRPHMSTGRYSSTTTAAPQGASDLHISNASRNVSVEFDPVHVPPGTFSIELIIDNREVRAKTDQTYIQNELISRGVEPTTRPLPLGDALWVARLAPEHAYLLGPAVEDGSMPSEVLLGHIAERKRLDDLIGSIKDGRFHEQKFRLRRSGIPNVLYIIEDIQLPPEAQQRTAEMVSSAIAGTMTVGGFFVKRTRKLDDTIAYLARMTNLLRKKYEGKSLKVVPSRALGDGRDIDGIKSLLKDESHFLTFDAFSALAGKSDNLTLRDVFLKMLMCTKGITGDKSLEIQRRWKTPKAFVESLQLGSGQDDLEEERRHREMLFEATRQLVGRRKIGKAASAKVAEIWGQV